MSVEELRLSVIKLAGTPCALIQYGHLLDLAPVALILPISQQPLRATPQRATRAVDHNRNCSSKSWEKSTLELLSLSLERRVKASVA